MLLITGLGNPGSRYAANRHNVGFMAVDEIARAHRFGPWTKKFQAEIADGTIAGEKVLLMKPATFMNNSGQAVGEAARFYKLTPADVVVIHDELDLVPGKVRVKAGGGNGGHNGLKSIDAHLGKDYRRVRIGIGHPGVKDLVSPYVLSDFAKADQEWLAPLLDAIARHAEVLVKGEDGLFMNRIAVATSSEEPPSAKGSAVAPAMRETAQKAPAKGQSHVFQARAAAAKPKVPAKGPMADMLKKLFGGARD
ncbi:aminoacyl-tRNA hydrolase [Consotaella salsifontis]|uniref:Peptidyl-tRNA hydrolase n=1 Tax=Consotaella salsifontis TaxID=1365950 RepID=A0A1T4NXA4_9HYPH|nr:aminoacyl-tRNA hydrolase [Consotaella salsifontis]SJZ83924.1 peptidyl-tRNA hydrolase [Consotaella salsifontis]